MSRVDDLLATLCPNGARYERIGAIADCTVGGTPASGEATYWDRGTIPWMTSGEVNKGTVFETDRAITRAGYDSCSAKMVPAGAVVIALAGQGKTRGTVARTRLALCTNQSLCAIVTGESVDSDFLYYFLRTQYRQLRSVSTGDGARRGLNLQLIRSYRVPVPPLEVQREIVKVLERFTELEAELEARRRQYIYYRSSLLTAAEANVTFAAFGDLFEMRAGSFIPAAAISAVRDAEHPYPCFGGGGLRGYVAEPNQSGDRVLIGRQGALCGNVKRSGGEFYATEHAVVVAARPEVDIGWAFHMLTAMNLNQYASKSAQPGLAVRNLERLRIPVPAHSDQRRIGFILDRFDALVNDLSIGLPAELAARRKQYEYYRDRLLTFPEAA